eukprot:scaffold177634_cov35-Tisochrysis_lutea.AAC.1
MEELLHDPDIRRESDALIAPKTNATPAPAEAAEKQRDGPFPLNVIRQAHAPSLQTISMLNEVGGLPALRRFTSSFYDKAFLDPHLDKFIREYASPSLQDCFAAHSVYPMSARSIDLPRTYNNIP